MPIATKLLPVPSTYTRILLQRWPGFGAELLQGTGLNAAAVSLAPTISSAQQLQIFRNVAALAARERGADWALDFGHRLNVNSHGPLGEAALSAPSLGEGLEVLARFARVRAPFLEFHTQLSEESFLFQINSRLVPLGALELPLVEIVLQIAVSFTEAVLGRRVTEARILVGVPPPDHAACYVDYFPVRCEFNAGIHALVLPSALLAAVCPLHDDNSYRTALLRCREALDGLLGENDMATRVNDLLVAHFDRPRIRGEAGTLPALDSIANRLSVSPRTLIRRLAEQGTSFRQLLESRQREAACSMLSQARYSVSDIAIHLGYSDAANFGRAFRRQTGQSPGHYRRQSN